MANLFSILVLLLLHVSSQSAQNANVHQFIHFTNDFAKEISWSVEETGIMKKTGHSLPNNNNNNNKKPTAGILPVCCHVEMEEVMFFECGNSLDYNGGKTSWQAPAHLVSTDVATRFRLEKSFLSCRSSNFTTNIYINESIAENNHFSTDGYLRYNDEYYRPDEYCINGFNSEKLEIIICKANCSDPQTPCINKCCGLNEIYSLGYGDNPRGCVTLENEDTKWYPKLYHDMYKALSPYEMVTINPHIVQNFPTNFKYQCTTKKTTIFPFGEDVAGYLSAHTSKPYLHLQFRLKSDGSLVYPQRFQNGTWAPVTSKLNNYCIDGVQDYGETEDYSNKEDETILFLCSGGPELGGTLNMNELSDNEHSPTPTPISTTSTSTAPQKWKYKHRPTPSSYTQKLKQKAQSKNSATSDTQALASQIVSTSRETESLPRQKLVSLPTCCNMGSNDVNDGLTHHCKGRSDSGYDRINGNEKTTAVWNVPPFYMTSSKLTNFTLKKKPIVCKSGRFQFQGFIHNFRRRGHRIGDSKKHGILPDGQLKYENEFYRPEEYCVNGISPRIVEVLICKPYCSSSETPCIQKCCGINEIYSLGLPSPKNPDTIPVRGCQPLNSDDTPWKPRLYHDMKTEISPTEFNSLKPHVVQKYPPEFQHNCYNNITLAFPYSKEVAIRLGPQEDQSNGIFRHLQFRVRKDGKVMYAYPDSEQGTPFTSIMDSAHYCIDGIRNYGETDSFSNEEIQTILFICAMNHPPTPAVADPLLVNVPSSSVPSSDPDSGESHTEETQTEAINAVSS